MSPEKVIRDGKVAVLVSPGFGAGWSTWAEGDAAEFVTFDRRLVEAAERKAHASEVEEILNALFGKAPYMGGWSDVEVRWVDQGTVFYINDYDGNESLRYPSDGSQDWRTA